MSICECPTCSRLGIGILLIQKDDVMVCPICGIIDLHQAP